MVAGFISNSLNEDKISIGSFSVHVTIIKFMDSLVSLDKKSIISFKSSVKIDLSSITYFTSAKKNILELFKFKLLAASNIVLPLLEIIVIGLSSTPFLPASIMFTNCKSSSYSLSTFFIPNAVIIPSSLSSL